MWGASCAMSRSQGADQKASSLGTTVLLVHLSNVQVPQRWGRGIPGVILIPQLDLAKEKQSDEKNNTLL